MNKKVLFVETTFGNVAAGFTENRIARFWLPGRSKKELAADIKKWAPDFASARDSRLEAGLKNYFNGVKINFDRPVEYNGFSGFHVAVLTELQKVEWGRTVTYKELAKRIGRPGAARAVGMVMANNPVPLIIPCHRVIRSDGKLGGFTAPSGTELKRRMLELESGRG